MSSDSDSTRVSPAYRLIHHYREQAMAAVEQYNDALVDGTVSLDIRRDLAKAALNYYDALHELRNEEVMDEPWDERGITWLKEYAGETVTVREQLPRKNGAKKATHRPKLLSVDPSHLEDVILELNDIAYELDLSVKVEEATEHNDPDHEDLHTLVELRGQDEAREQLPGGE